LARGQRYGAKLRQRLAATPADGEADRLATLQHIYSELLQRDLDPSGKTYWLQRISEGMPLADIALFLARSDEYTNRIARERFFLQDLRELRPDRYSTAHDSANGKETPVFIAHTPDDFDWLEQSILKYGYYNKPGIWTDDINDDKRVLAEIIGSFEPTRPLEIGCSTGGVLHCLLELGIRGEGVEISKRAKQNGYPDVQDAIHLGDLFEVELESGYDFIYGLDIFEHLNPNRLGAYLTRLKSLLRSPGWILCNIPAFGRDEVFGEVFPLYVDSWHQDGDAGHPFMEIHVDDEGYPMNGHLIWALSSWWQSQFEQAGLDREYEIERALHHKYDAFFDTHARARKSLYVFSLECSQSDVAQTIQRIKGVPSSVGVSPG
jgi:SAM-dependent methyltransferase